MGGLGDRLYERLPVSLQHAAVSCYGAYWRWLRFGPGYAEALVGYRERERFGGGDWDAYQRAAVARLLGDAVRHVPYYRDTWTRSQRKAAMAGDLGGLPLLEKRAVRDDARRFVRADVRPRRSLTFHTSGSTGTPIATIWTVAELRDSLALREARSAGWAGVSFAMPRATFSGRLVEPNASSRGPFYRFNAAERQVYLSAFHLKRATAAQYVDGLRRHRVRWLTGYAFSYYQLARFMLDERVEAPPDVSAVVTTSEKVTPEMRATIEEAFRCPVYEEYSTVENALFASECDRGSLHASPDVAVVEILRPDGTYCAPGEVGEVVATCLIRPYQPLVRYRLGDLAAWSKGACPCGREMPVVQEVTGRIEDVVVGPDGRRLVRFHGVFVDMPAVQEGQIIQESLRSIRVKVVPAGAFGEPDVEAIKLRVAARLGPEVETAVDVVDHIPRTAAGKFKAVVSLLDERRASG